MTQIRQILYLWPPSHWWGHSSCCWGRHRRWSGTQCQVPAPWQWPLFCLLTQWTLGEDHLDWWARTSPGTLSPTSHCARTGPRFRWWPRQQLSPLEETLGEGKCIKANQLEIALYHRVSTTKTKCKLQNHIWLRVKSCQKKKRKVNKEQTIATRTQKKLFSSQWNNFSIEAEWSLRMEGNYILLDLLFK